MFLKHEPVIEFVLTEGGRLYLAKDPRLSGWHRVRDRMDPDRNFTSDLARRLLL